MLTAIVPVVIIIAAVIMIAKWNISFDYQCEYCLQIFSLSFVEAVLSMHCMGKKLVYCPHCGARTWAVPVPKEK